MAILKSSVVQGNMRITDTTYTTSLVVSDTTTPTIATDYLTMIDTSDGNKVVRGPLFDGSSETSLLSKKGTWIQIQGNDPINVGVSGGKITVSLSSSYNPFSGSQTKNTVFAAPSTANGVPAFRALVAADMPVATTAAKGAVKVGDTLSISNEILNVKYGTTASTSLQGNQNLFKLNNVSKNVAANASIYAPTTGGTEGYILGSAGATTEPTWVNKGNGRIFYGTCNTAAATAAKVVVCAQYDELQNGDIMIVTFANTNTTNTALTMSITDGDAVTTDAKEIKCQVVTSISNIPAVGYLIAARPYMFVYDGTYWVMMNVNRDNNDNSIAYQTRYSQNVFTLDNTTNDAGRTLYRYQLMLQKPDGQMTPVSMKGNSTATNDETIYDGEFLIQGDILYYSYTGTVNPGAKISASYLWKQADMNLSYSFNTGSTLIAGKPVYLVAKPTYVDSLYATLYKNNTWSNMAIDATTGRGAGCITQSLDQAMAGYIYIHLGYAYNTTNITLSERHPIYEAIVYGHVIPYGYNTAKSVFLGNIVSLNGFKSIIINYAKTHGNYGWLSIPVHFGASNITSNWNESNLKQTKNNEIITTDYAGLLQCFNANYSSTGELATISGSILFKEEPITNVDEIDPQVYIWYFCYDVGDTSYGTWKYCYARGLAEENIVSTLSQPSTVAETINESFYKIKQRTDGIIEAYSAPINVVHGANNLVLLATNWSSTAPYTQTISSSDLYFSRTFEPIVGLDTNGITQEIYEQACEAQIVCTNYSLGASSSTFTFTAFGEKPTVNIPINITTFFKARIT